MRLPQAIGLGPLTRSLLYQDRCTFGTSRLLAAEWIYHLKRTQSRAAVISARHLLTRHIQHSNTKQWPRSRARSALQSGPSLIHLSRLRSSAAPPPRAWPAALHSHHSSRGGRRRTSDFSHGSAVASSGRTTTTGARHSSAASQHRRLGRDGKSSMDRVSETRLSF